MAQYIVKRRSKLMNNETEKDIQTENDELRKK